MGRLERPWSEEREAIVDHELFNMCLEDYQRALELVRQYLSKS